jgi:hypothetical protein
MLSLRSFLHFSNVDIIDNNKTLGCLAYFYDCAELAKHRMLITVQTDPVEVSKMPIPPWHLP